MNTTKNDVIKSVTTCPNGKMSLEMALKKMLFSFMNIKNSLFKGITSAKRQCFVTLFQCKLLIFYLWMWAVHLFTCRRGRRRSDSQYSCP